MKKRFIGLLVPGIVLGIWWVYSTLADNLYFPSVGNILNTFANVWFGAGFFEHILPSLFNWILGYVLGAVAAILFGLWIGSSSILIQLTRVPVEFARALPPPALIPVAIAILGVGEEMKWGVIAFGAFFPILLATTDGVRGTEGGLIDTAKMYRIQGKWSWTRIVLPSAAPQIVAGMKVSLSISLLLMIVSEMVASVRGLGFFTLQAQRTFAYTEMWAGIILLGLIGFLANFIFEKISDRVLYWQPQN